MTDPPDIDIANLVPLSSMKNERVIEDRLFKGIGKTSLNWSRVTKRRGQVWCIGRPQGVAAHQHLEIGFKRLEIGVQFARSLRLTQQGR